MQRAKRLFDDTKAAVVDKSHTHPRYEQANAAYQAADVLVSLYETADSTILYSRLCLLLRLLMSRRHGIGKRLLMPDLGYLCMVHRHYRSRLETHGSPLDRNIVETCGQIMDARCPVS
jgi:hypothetical protein